MPKGKPWSREETKQLLELRGDGKTTTEIADRMGKSRDAIKQKLRRLGLKVVTIENLCARASKTDVMRLRTLIQTSTIYQKRFAEYVGYRNIERKVIEANELMERRAKARDDKKMNASEQDDIRS
jgi:hypothetical protein